MHNLVTGALVKHLANHKVESNQHLTAAEFLTENTDYAALDAGAATTAADLTEACGSIQFFQHATERKIVALCYFHGCMQGPPNGVHGGGVFQCFHDGFTAALPLVNNPRPSSSAGAAKAPLLKHMEVSFKALTPLERNVLMEVWVVGEDGDGRLQAVLKDHESGKVLAESSCDAF